MFPKAFRLGFIGLDVVRMDEMRAYYEHILGLSLTPEGGRDVHLACGTDHHALSLHPGERSGFRHLGLQVACEGGLAEARAALAAEGIDARLQSDRIPGVRNCIEIQDPDGYTLFLFEEMAPSPVRFEARGIAPDKLGHLALYTRDARRGFDFYSRALGFRWSDWLEDLFVFMRCNADHHTVNLLTSAKRRGLFHLAFELRDLTHLGRACDLLATAGFPLVFGPGRHGLGHNLFLYHRDPDGNLVEMFAELDRMSDERQGFFDPRPHHREFPQRPRIWPDVPETGNIWGVEPPPGFLE
jgi:catechol-2,3-dioxygenase